MTMRDRASPHVAKLAERGMAAASHHRVHVAAGGLVSLSDTTLFPTAVVWWVGLLVDGTPLVVQTAREVASGRFAVDLVATLAILLALVLWEPLAGLVIVLMQSGGEALERYAERKATDAVRALEDAAPRIAHRIH
jgi:cation transport ATPase